MADYSSQISVGAGPATAFSYLVDIENMAEWDPNVRSVKALGDGRPCVGSSYALIIGFYGKPIELIGEVVELESPHRIVLSLDGGRVRGRYMFEVCGRFGSASGTDTDAKGTSNVASDVSYQLKLELRGVARFLDRGLQLALNGIGENAVSGLRKQLNARAG